LICQLKNGTTEMIAIIDCNNFYASCERLFRPELRTMPIVVLSNNDGCVIARSDEAKEAGVKMGAVFHHIKHFLDTSRIHYFSSNYQLYGDMSDRVMRCLQNINPQIEVYSIDEAFLNLDKIHLPKGGLVEYGRLIKQTVLKQTGIPVSVGIAPTKVLAKIANRVAKKRKQTTGGVFVLDSQEQTEAILKETPLGDVWGIGYRKALKLKSDFGMTTAFDCYKNMTDEVMQKQFGGVVGLRVLRELRGLKSIEISPGAAEKKHIATTRSFGRAITNFSDLSEAIASYAEQAHQKLQAQHSACKSVGVYIRSDPFKKELGYYSKTNYGNLYHPTNNPHEIIAKALALLSEIFLPRFAYTKAGVFLSSFEDTHVRQLALFEEDSLVLKELSKAEKLANLLANSEKKFGNNQISTAAAGVNPEWQMRMSYCSPHYTTNWSQLPMVSK